MEGATSEQRVRAYLGLGANIGDFAALAKADTLLALHIGAFCQHKSWGFGRVKAFDASLERIVVAFPHNPDHAMQLAYAAAAHWPAMWPR